MVSVTDEDDVQTIMAGVQDLFDRARRFHTRQALNVHPLLDPPLYSLMLELARLQPARASDLVTVRQVDKALISRQVAALERLGLVLRRPDPTDSRASLLELSEAGIKAHEEFLARRQRFAAQLFENLSGDERRTIVDGLSLLRRALDTAGAT
jgi:DNA-binding MarR family transcriptional regulator